MSTVTRKTHTDTEYEKELADLRETIVEMGGRVELMCSESIKSLVGGEEEIARHVIRSDKKVDQLEKRIDEIVHHVLARRQPVGKDLRFITTALKIAADLERVGDLSVNLAERVLELIDEPRLKAYVDIPRMAASAREMVKDSLDSFLNEDSNLARKVIWSDDEVDDLNEQLFRELLTYMMQDPNNIGRATRLTFISKYIERMADHATSIGKSVIFMVDGIPYSRREA